MSHREEAFAMLAVNAWEVLLKARIVRDNGNRIRSIQVLAPIQCKDGTKGKRLRLERNPAGNPKTIKIGEAVRRVEPAPTNKLDTACAANLWSMVEIRNNAVHFLNEDFELSRRVYEVGSACLRNYAAAVGDWFNSDLSKHRFMILPLSFEGVGEGLVIPARRSKQMANLMAYLDRASDGHPLREGNPYAASLRIETRIVGSRNKDASAVRLGGGLDAPVISLSDEEALQGWSLDYDTLRARVKTRMPEVKFNASFHAAVRDLKGNQKMVLRRSLDPRDLNCTSNKDFYSDAAVDAVCKAIEAAKAAKAE
jgi:hypothetical protein